MVGSSNHPMAKYGRNGDSVMAHLTPGEMVLPKPVLDANPHLAAMIAQAIANAGADPEQYRVGEDMSINPETGQPEFGFFSKGIGRILKIAAPIVLSFALPGVGTALGAGLGATTAAGQAALGGAVLGGGIGALGGGGLKGAAIGAATGGAGGYIQGSGGLAGAANNLGFGNAAYSALDSGSELFSGLANLGAGGGSMFDTAGKVLQAASLFCAGGQPQALADQRIGNPAPSAGEVPQFFPKRPSPLNRPESLSDLSGFSPEQERSALATRGKNVGLGAQENSYYQNLVQRSLIGDGGQVNTSNPNALLPIESSYLSRGGYNTSDISALLRQLQG